MVNYRPSQVLCQINMEGKTVLVTGSTSGIGLATAKMFLNRGCDVIVTGIAEQSVIDNVLSDMSKLPGKVIFIPVDLTEKSSIHAFCQNVDAVYPDGVDVLINNAGIQHVCPVEEFPDVKWDEMIGVCLSAPFHLIKHFLSAMKRKGWGRIINMSSQMGLISAPGKAPYSAAKSGLIGLTKGVALEAAEFGVTCNAVCPGFCVTAMTDKQFVVLAEKWNTTAAEAKERFIREGHPTKKATEISQVTDYIWFLCSPGADNMTGTAVPLDGGNTSR
ncbi:D-beta-hydroxybutyrate dehydrogenase-like [Liolophura sinensis]|uniref:D-beta-hydroxybutyrate dehydrogenase-like n=1 Tax=Liolophura sinensis TaxID=3198878 RepID=UPI0031586066